MGKKVKWSWNSALIGAVAATATAALVTAKPKDPTFQLISIKLTSFKLKFPVLDAEVILTVHVVNPNITPIKYSSTTMSIFYEGSLLGSAPVKAGSQAAGSCQLLHIPARLDGLELAHHARKFFADVAKREMLFEAKVDIEGTAKVLWWDHKFKIHVDSHVTVDPVFLDVIDQENKSELETMSRANSKSKSNNNNIQVNVRRTEANKPQKLVPILISEPLHVPGMVKLHECKSYTNLFEEIARIHTELSGIPQRRSLADPMPGFVLNYLPPSDDLPDLNPRTEPWERFSAALDLITAVPISAFR
ncbi:hypothetical protein WN944_027545 [Citrus x changshan-huyou]|uniref:Water stress and hypersensitive response domain-containing protein n=1 Tax=Citrus x changshan-huyou TaxID=2935761 RepID=A0AAP0LHQ4_9ROSI